MGSYGVLLKCRSVPLNYLRAVSYLSPCTVLTESMSKSDKCYSHGETFIHGKYTTDISTKPQLPCHGHKELLKAKLHYRLQSVHLTMLVIHRKAQIMLNAIHRKNKQHTITSTLAMLVYYILKYPVHCTLR